MLTGAHLVWLLLLGAVLYVLDALKNLLIRSRKDPFIVLAALATIIYAVFAYNQWQVMRGQLGEMKTASIGVGRGCRSPMVGSPVPKAAEVAEFLQANDGS